MLKLFCLLLLETNSISGLIGYDCARNNLEIQKFDATRVKACNATINK